MNIIKNNLVKSINKIAKEIEFKNKGKVIEQILIEFVPKNNITNVEFVLEDPYLPTHMFFISKDGSFKRDTGWDKRQKGWRGFFNPIDKDVLELEGDIQTRHLKQQNENKENK